MNSSQAIEAIKTLGSVAGLLSGLFLIYDRIAKGRPIASLTILMDGTRKSPCIRISNIAPHDVAITNIKVSPRTYFLTDDLEVRSLVRGAAGRNPYFMVKAGESRELKIAPLFKDGLAETVLRIPRERQTRAHFFTVKNIMRRLGWEHSKNIKIGGVQGKGYSRLVNEPTPSVPANDPNLPDDPEF